MMNTVWAVMREGKFVPLEDVEVPEGTRVLVTLLPDDDASFWLMASQPSLDAVWNNLEDDVYAELLES
ncbi:MAG: antitoxin family protein [Pyrinomonadaceae bacterium]